MNGGVARLLLIREARDPYVATKRPAPGLYDQSAGSVIRGRNAPDPKAERGLMIRGRPTRRTSMRRTRDP